MNKIAYICREIYEDSSITQRALATKMDISLGSVNKLIAECRDYAYIEQHDSLLNLTALGLEFLKPFHIDCAVIFAAGFGSRFVPLTYENPKGLLEVFGERMIERQIKQLHEVGIEDITIVVGYLKEKFDYLIDKYHVKLLYNPEYSTKNTIATLWYARDLFYNRNTYLLCSDNWMRNNMYHSYEPGAWYSACYAKGTTKEWCLTYNKKGIITDVSVGGEDSWFMYGPAYMSREFSDAFLPMIEKYYQTPGTEQFYWERVFADWISGNDIFSNLAVPEMSINKQPADQVYEFENLEELRIFDTKYQDTSDNKAMQLISKVFKVPESSIINIRCLKAGMTNNSFLFSVHNKHYICRIPGVGTSLLINRREEYDSYEAVKSLDISDHIVYFCPESGYKIAEYYEDSSKAAPSDWDSIARCMKLLKKLHDSKLEVSHTFNVRERMDFYEQLCLESGGIPFEDYREVKKYMTELLDLLDDMNRPKVLSHIDSVYDNFLFVHDAHGHEDIRLIDWEYSGMADPLIDVAMSAIYSHYSPEETDKLVEIYLERSPTDEERSVIWSYMALGGFLWALWAIYKSNLGVSFGEYTLIMYRYAKDYYKKVKNN